MTPTSTKQKNKYRAMSWVLFVSSALFIFTPSHLRSDHPGASIDEAMDAREKYFESVDQSAPLATLTGPNGQSISLRDLRDRVVILHFIYTTCTDVCPLHTEKLAEVQSLLQGTPMEDRVYFVSISTDPSRDTPDILRAYGNARGMEDSNWVPLTTAPDQPENTTRELAKAFGHEFRKESSFHQAHGVVTHILDRGGRWAANFYGLNFDSVNMVVYTNSLINNSYATDVDSATSWWQRLYGYFFDD